MKYGSRRDQHKVTWRPFRQTSRVVGPTREKCGLLKCPLAVLLLLAVATRALEDLLGQNTEAKERNMDKTMGTWVHILNSLKGP